ncbi:MAG: hypothetical protein K6E91_13545 [Butyrivibrio sp.]|nr:hypothetical protein [Butyrivibrio sp.]
MIADITVILLSCAVFLALILYVALEQEQRERITGICFLLAALGGIVIYGFSYSSVQSSHTENLAAVIHTLVDVGRMFVGVNNEGIFLSALAESGTSSPGFKLLFWVVHFLAYYSMASAAVMTLGKGAVRRLRIMLLFLRDVELIYGITDNSIIYGKRIAARKQGSVVFAGNAAPSQETVIRQMGAIVFSDDAAMEPSKSFLKLLHLRKNNHLRLYAFSESADLNFNYALRMKKLLQEENVKPEYTSLVLLGREESYGADLLAADGRYGYGEIKAFDNSELTARLLVQKYPVCDVVEFDDNKLSTTDVEVLVVGFNKVGQEVLKKLIANGQFEGSQFRAYVFDPDLDNISGFFNARYKAMLDAFSIYMSSDGWQSVNFCDFLQKHAQSLSYIVIAVENNNLAGEIAGDIMGLLSRNGRNMPIYQCNEGSVICHRRDKENDISNLYDADILYSGQIDELAMEINHYYNSSNLSSKELWAGCDYFSRMSCRASADFFTVFLKRLNISTAENISETQMENLARTEHKRWCAFHYTMGYQCMSREEWEERAQKYLQQKESGEQKLIRISKDTAALKHACLISWDELDDLSKRENFITGKNVDYKQLDRNNVSVLINMLSAKTKSD